MKARRFAMITLFVLTKSILQAQVLPVNQHPVEKPALFSALPQKISFSTALLASIFSYELNKDVSVRISEDLTIQGLVLSRVSVSNTQLNINIRCRNYQNGLLNICRIETSKGEFKYTGRLISPNHGDLYVLQFADGRYSLVRLKQQFTMTE